MINLELKQKLRIPITLWEFMLKSFHNKYKIVNHFEACYEIHNDKESSKSEDGKSTLKSSAKRVSNT